MFILYPNIVEMFIKMMFVFFFLGFPNLSKAIYDNDYHFYKAVEMFYKKEIHNIPYDAEDLAEIQKWLMHDKMNFVRLYRKKIQSKDDGVSWSRSININAIDFLPDNNDIRYSYVEYAVLNTNQTPIIEGPNHYWCGFWGKWMSVYGLNYDYWSNLGKGIPDIYRNMVPYDSLYYCLIHNIKSW